MKKSIFISSVLMSICLLQNPSYSTTISKLQSLRNDESNLPVVLNNNGIPEVYSYDYLDLNTIYCREFLKKPRVINALPMNNIEADKKNLICIPILGNSNYKALWTGSPLETDLVPSFKIYTITNVRYDSRIVESMNISVSNFTSLDIQMASAIGAYANVSFYVDAEVEFKIGLKMEIGQSLSAARSVDTSCLDDTHQLYGIFAQFYKCKKIYLFEDYNGNITKGWYFPSHASTMYTYHLEALD